MRKSGGLREEVLEVEVAKAKYHCRSSDHPYWTSAVVKPIMFLNLGICLSFYLLSFSLLHTNTYTISNHF